MKVAMRAHTITYLAIGLEYDHTMGDISVGYLTGAQEGDSVPKRGQQ